MTFTMTIPCIDYLKQLIEKQEAVIGVRVHVENPGKITAETLLTYCRENNKQYNDHILDYDGLKVYVQNDSLVYLDDAEFVYEDSTLTINAPRSKPEIDENQSVIDRAKFVVDNYINPELAMHGGECEIEGIYAMEGTSMHIAHIKFSGGCQGCFAATDTQVGLVDQLLQQHVPEISGTKDITDHSDQTNAYYKDASDI